MSNNEKMILAMIIAISVCRRSSVSEIAPAVSEPITRVMVKRVVINPICATLRVRFMFMKRGAARVMMPLLIEMMGKRSAKQRVVFFLNSLVMILKSFFCRGCSRGFFVIKGMIMSKRMMIPAVVNARGKLVCSAMFVRSTDPIAVPVKNPAIIDPLILPRSFFVVSVIAHASMETSKIPIPD